MIGFWNVPLDQWLAEQYQCMSISSFPAYCLHFIIIEWSDIHIDLQFIIKQEWRNMFTHSDPNWDPKEQDYCKIFQKQKCLCVLTTPKQSCQITRYIYMLIIYIDKLIEQGFICTLLCPVKKSLENIRSTARVLL